LKSAEAGMRRPCQGGLNVQPVFKRKASWPEGPSATGVCDNSDPPLEGYLSRRAAVAILVHEFLL
jgi:hypothetical protein